MSTLPHALPPRFGRSVAVVIGINSYSQGLQPLQNALHDANAVGDALRNQGFEVLRLLDSEASLNSLSHLFSHHLQSLEPAPDRLLIYFAGHGLAHTDAQHNLSGFLLPADARRDDLSSYLPMDFLRKALGQLRCGHLLLILDCCFAGAFLRSASRDINPLEDPAPPLFLERFRHLASRRSFQVLLSTAHDELASDKLLAKPSQEFLGDGLHSPFANALLEALEQPSAADFNQDGLLTASELYVFLSNRIIPSPGYQQTPSLWNLDWHDHGEFLFLLSDSFPQLPSAAPLSKETNPYLGLRPFSAQHRHLFFGRERLVDTLVERICARPLLLLCAPSGAGKSSLVHAGVLPRFEDRGSWLIPPSLRPSSRPLQALSAWLATLSPESPSAEELNSQPHLAAGLLEDFLSRHPERSLLLVVDPLEELVTSCLDDASRLAFLRTLASLLQLSLPRLHLLLLLRSDFEPYFLTLLQTSCFPVSLWRDARCTLPPMNRDDLRRCIERPAESCVLFFSRGMVDRILDDVEQMPGALPLLSVALRELFDAYIESGREDRTLSDSDYEGIGGIAGALQRRAELVFSGARPASFEGQSVSLPIPAEEVPAYQHTLRNVLLRMVSPEGSEPTRRRVPRSELEYLSSRENTRVRWVLAALESSRLIVAHAADDAEPSVEPAHDALLSAWPRLHDWARHAQRELLLQRRICAAANEWCRQQRSTDFLWVDTRLDQLGLPAESLRRTDLPLTLPTYSHTGSPAEPLTFNAAESDFLRASAARQRLLRRRRSLLAVAAASSLVTLTGVALLQASRAESSAQEARQQKREAETNAAEARKQQNAANASAAEALRQKEAAESNAAEARRQKEAADANAAEARRQAARVLASARLTKADELLEVDPTKALLVLREVLHQPDQLPSNWLQIGIDIHQQAISSSILGGYSAAVRRAVFSPDSSKILTIPTNGDIRLWRADGRGDSVHLGSQAIHAVFSPDGSRVLVGYADGTARLWSPGSAGPPVLIKGHDRRVRFVSFSPDGSRLLTGSEDNTVRLWSADGRELIATLGGLAGSLQAVSFSPDGSLVLAADSLGTVYLWRAGSASQLARLSGSKSPVKVALFHPDGSRVLVARADGTVSLQPVDGVSPPSSIQGHSGHVESAAFSPDGSRLLTLDAQGAAYLWRVEPTCGSQGCSGPATVKLATLTPQGELSMESGAEGTICTPLADDSGSGNGTGRVTSVTLSPGGSVILATYRNGTARAWRMEGRCRSLTFRGHSRALTSATFSHDGTRVLTASEDGTARIWRVEGAGPSSLSRYEGEVTVHGFSADGALVLTSSANGAVYIWREDGSRFPVPPTTPLKGITAARLSPDGSRVFVAAADGTALLQRLDGSGQSIALEGHTDIIQSAVFSVDGSRVVTASMDSTARIWHVNGERGPIPLVGHTGPVSYAEFSPDGSRVVTVSTDGTARLWSSGGRALRTLEGHSGAVRAARFNSSGSLILTLSDDNTARVWRTDGRGPPIILSLGTTALRTATFSPDGSHILSVSSSGSVHLWRADGREPPRELRGHTLAVNSATFTPDGRYVLTGSEDKTARLWSVDGVGEPVSLVGHEASVEVVTASLTRERTLLILTASRDGTARLWQVDGQGNSIATLRHMGHDGLRGASFLAGGSRMVTWSEEDLFFWPIKPDTLLAHAQNSTSVRLSLEERRLYLLEPPTEPPIDSSPRGGPGARSPGQWFSQFSGPGQVGVASSAGEPP